MTLKKGNAEKTAAIVTFNDPANYSLEGKKAVAKWLRHQANILMKSNKFLAKKYCVRYLYQEEDNATKKG